MFVTRDLVGGVGAIAIGASYYVYASQIRISALDDSVGPSGVPKVYGLIMIGLGLVIALSAIVKSFRARATNQVSGSEWAGQGKKIFRAGGILLIGIGYLLLVSQIGYALGIALLLLATAFYQGAHFNWRLFAVSFGGAAVLWCVFVLLLGVSMPQGLFFQF